ncbi:DUF3987 domain-containing protein [Pseudonocardia spinosispora]|uniref:DUF3987 domain-containing protein n=1 Tax=Pseudonocardia spinosispora TaxID=103441 RepID=UPI000416A4DC|nr:DUF3987 domain-containing protein [Pseudonocardia spinosispora]
MNTAHLRAIPTHQPTTTTATAISGHSDEAGPAELAARAEVARARRELPRVDDAVWNCYLGDLTARIAPTSEADPINIYASLLCAAGVHLGQKPRVQAGDDRHPLLVWPLIVGRSGAGRKGAGWSAARRLITSADPEFAATNIRSGLTSGEGLAIIFAEDDDPTDDSKAGNRKDQPKAGGLLPPGDRRLMVFEPEWAAVMARMRREGNTLSATLRAAWEGGDLSTLNVTARVAPNSHVGLLTHITPDEFRAKVSASDLAGGTYNRFLPLAVARSQFLPLSTGASDNVIAEHGIDFGRRLTEGAQLDTINLTPTATQLWRELYVEFGIDHGDTGPVEQFLARTAPNTLRIAAIHAAIDHTTHITTEHLHAAAGLVRYSIASVRTVFENNEDVAQLLAYITDAGPAGRTKQDITSGHYGGNKKAGDINTLLNRLITTGAITHAQRPRADGKPGRPTAIYIAG